jgi:hypothetical protein
MHFTNFATNFPSNRATVSARRSVQTRTGTARRKREHGRMVNMHCSNNSVKSNPPRHEGSIAGPKVLSLASQGLTDGVSVKAMARSSIAISC